MRRRLFLTSGSAAAFLAMTGCGGGGGGGDSALSSGTNAASSSTGSTASLPTSVAAAAPSTAPAANAAQSSAGTGYAFGSRMDAYVAGTRPAVATASMDAMLTKQYDAWKAARLVPMDSAAPGGYVVKFSDPNFITVSEGMGYGMLLAVLFAGHDPDAKKVFDGLLAVVRARPSYGISAVNPVGKYLMDWRLYTNGASGGEGWNAMDGDLDIAMALLMAHRQWGSSGTWNYLEEGKATINALKVWNMAADGTTKGLRLSHVSRTSDYMIGHFRAFKQATGDGFWDTAIDRAFQLTELCQTRFSSAGLMPDFLMNTDGTPIPSTGYVGDGNDKEGFFWWNACRNPWRFASDYVLSGDTRSATATNRMIDFFQKASGGDPVNIGTGYSLDGTQLTGGNSPAYHGPICAGACTNAKYQGFADALWNWNSRNLTTGYYDGEIQLLSLVVASGNWWSTARG